MSVLLFDLGALPKVSGRVKWFNSNKHYGFIVAEDEQEVFFHEQHLLPGGIKGPNKGQSVRFHVRNTFKGPEALNVELVVDKAAIQEPATS